MIFRLSVFLVIVGQCSGLKNAWPQVDSDGSLSFLNRSEIESQVTSGQLACPTFLPDVVLDYFTTVLSDAETFVNVELPPFLQVRFPNSQGNVLVREYIKLQFQTLGWQVEEDASVQATPLGFLPFVNVIATWNPTAVRRVVLACHYDSLLQPAGFIGAIDAAVPCALLIDLAKRLTPVFQFITSFISIQMIFIDGEEAFISFTAQDSLYGSRQLASVWENTLDPNDNTKNRLANIETFILLDIIGHSGTQFQRFHPETDDLYTQLLQFEACLALGGRLLRPLPLSLQFFQNSVRTQAILDDHIPFQQRGVNIMHLISFPFPATWHTLEDNFNNLNFVIIEDLNRILRVFLGNYYLINSFDPVNNINS